LSWSDDAADACNTAFATFGTPGTYTAPGGSPVLCTVIPKSKDRMVSFGEGRPFAEGTIVEVRASEIAAPVKAGVFNINAVNVTILADPETLDDLRLVWICRVK
jgi:hypothetical protein